MRKSPAVMCACLYNAQYTHAFYANDATLYMLHTFRAETKVNTNKLSLLLEARIG